MGELKNLRNNQDEKVANIEQQMKALKEAQRLTEEAVYRADSVEITGTDSELKKFVNKRMIFTWNIALWSKSNGRCDIKAEKREELESKSSHKSDIWPPAASKKWGEIYWKYIFQTLEAIFPYKGVFVTKVVKANIIAFIKTKILRPVLSVTNPPFQKCQPLLHSAMPNPACQ